MNAMYKPRPWIKVQLSVSPPAEEAAALVKAWKTERHAAAQLIRAVRLYAGLCRGELGILDDYFPGLVRGNPSFTAPQRQAASLKPVIMYQASSDQDDLADVLEGLGLESLEFDPE